ncbi:hypothetical protein [Nitrosopumilus sp. b2]|uniref:hypothetical protein n=1 Tax=Nitrosopumilus sp. b2 TaxID=2109908 RepID=UPI0015F4F14F|nr:hypothetical protein [Nitrosopumilus sp. b2]
METIVIRAKDYKDLPDLELCVEGLKKDGILKALGEKNNITVEELLKKPFLEKKAIIFEDTEYTDFKSGDILIYQNGNFKIFTGISRDE